MTYIRDGRHAELVNELVREDDDETCTETLIRRLVAASALYEHELVLERQEADQ